MRPGSPAPFHVAARPGLRLVGGDARIDPARSGARRHTHAIEAERGDEAAAAEGEVRAGTVAQELRAHLANVTNLDPDRVPVVLDHDWGRLRREPGFHQ